MNSAPTITPEQEAGLLEAARSGNEGAYGRLIEGYRSDLNAHCYRMLGSVQDAEDALQEVLLRAWRGLGGFQGRSSLRTWLYRIATNVCLEAIRKRPKRVLPIDYGPPADPHDAPRLDRGAGEPLVESVWIEPYPDDKLDLESDFAAPEARYEQREGIELAFVAALQHLPAGQRAALILRDVLGFSAKESAEALETTTATVTSSLQRARKTVEDRLPEQSQQATLRLVGEDGVKEVVEQYVDAFERGDVDAVVGMLAEDAAIAMPPYATWYRGRDAVAAFLPHGPFAPSNQWRVIPTQANGQPAFAHYIRREGSGSYVGHDIVVLDLADPSADGPIDQITAFISEDATRAFGLPGELPARD
jgi:RNA polymerase sigma-70 factor (ECF subfamily)